MNHTITISISLQELEELIENLLLKHLPKHSKTQQKLLTIDEAALFLGIPKNTLYQFTSKRLISFMKLGRRIMFEETTLLEWAREHKKITKSEIENQL